MCPFSALRTHTFFYPNKLPAELQVLCVSAVRGGVLALP